MKISGLSTRVLRGPGVVTYGSWEVLMGARTYLWVQHWILRPFNPIFGSFVKILGPSTRVLKARGFLAGPGVGTYG